ncbi:MAG: hypothetical protein JSU95_03480 [Betaproteobacteria bacterium]|nr:MAG: hypothetical protein JSU95_03480 [Betaproteobacteria bacterium]
MMFICRRGFRVLAGRVSVLVALVLSACVAPIRYETAIPQLPTGSQGRIQSDLIELDLPELTVQAQLQAINWSGQYLLPPLGLWLNIEPKSDSVRLNTARISLVSDGQVTPTVAYLGPDTAWFSPRALAAGCGPRFYRTGIGLTRLAVSQEAVNRADNEMGIFRPSDEPILLKKASCFMFWFDTDPQPDHTFELKLEGFSYNGNPVVIPHILFEKGTVGQVRGFP